MAAHKQTQGEFKNGILEKIEAERPGLSKADVNAVLAAVVAQAQEDLAGGFEVPLLGLVALKPVAKKGRKKGTEVRNPFDGSVKTLKKDEPDSIRIKGFARAAAKSSVPSGARLAALVKEIS